MLLPPIVSFDTIGLEELNSGLIWGGPPCAACTLELIQAGIKEVVTMPFKNVQSRWKDDIQYARFLLNEAGITYREVNQCET
jgi:deoxycytidylate deaminase